jgi:membrane protease YdiL (CAAX protease family)
MNQPPDPLPESTVPADAVPVILPQYKGCTKLSWLVILGTVGAIIGVRMLPAAVEKQATLASRIDLKLIRAQGQALVAIRRLASRTEPGELYAQAQTLAGDDPARQLRVSALAADLVGPKEALRLVDEARQQGDKLSDDDRRLIDVLGRLYRDQQRGAFYHPSVNDNDAAFLKERLGWFGSLALQPTIAEDRLQEQAAAAGLLGPALLEQYREGRQQVADEATHTLSVLGVLVAVVSMLLGLGFLGLPLFVVLWLIGVVRVGLKPGIAHGGVYAETFAIWLLLYVGLLLTGEFLLYDMAITVRGSLAMPLSLAVVAWPVVRGVPWHRVRQDIGWTLGRAPLLEPACGWVCYLINMPLVVAGFLMTMILAKLSASLSQLGDGEPATPTHPVLEQFANLDWANLLLLFVLLSVIAPLIEETMFRGFLHRHLRETFLPRRPLLAGVATALIVNLLFAAVHPQGLTFIPVLTALACGFSLAREWRGTLIPAMVAHGTNNFLAGLLGILLLAR